MMALSNILREPRRELTETAVGLAIVVPLIYADYSFGQWLQDYAGYDKHGDAHLPWVIGMGVGTLAGIAISLSAIIIHALGTAICDTLDKHDIHLRPRQRPTK